MSPRITIHLFGRFSFNCDDRELLLRTPRKAKEILCYLITNRRKPVPRDHLARLVHGGSADRSKPALRSVLWELRAELRRSGAERVLRIDDGWGQFVQDDDVWVDVSEFESAAKDPTRLAEAIQLYRDEFLQTCDNSWCLEERERLRQIYLESLDSLVEGCEEEGNVKAGVAYATLALHDDPARECTHRALMRIYRHAGDRASALRQYEHCVAALRIELSVGPDEKTRALEGEIRSGQLQAHADRSNPRPSQMHDQTDGRVLRVAGSMPSGRGKRST